LGDAYFWIADFVRWVGAFGSVILPYAYSVVNHCPVNQQAKSVRFAAQPAYKTDLAGGVAVSSAFSLRLAVVSVSAAKELQRCASANVQNVRIRGESGRFVSSKMIRCGLIWEEWRAGFKPPAGE
jgi:hypothetical protein